MRNYKTPTNEDRECIIASYLKGNTVTEIASMLNRKQVYSATGRIQEGKCGGNRVGVLSKEI